MVLLLMLTKEHRTFQIIKCHKKIYKYFDRLLINKVVKFPPENTCKTFFLYDKTNRLQKTLYKLQPEEKVDI